MGNLSQNDATMIEIMRAVGIADYGIRHLTDLRARNQRVPLEETQESKRLVFYRALAETGRIGRGDRHPSLATIKDLRWIDFAGGTCTHQPPYSG